MILHLVNLSREASSRPTQSPHAPMPNHPDRLLRLQGASNFRDLGGYLGDGGRPLRWRRLFRAEHLAGLTEADRATLSRLGLTRALDFRGLAERAATPYQWPGITSHALAIEPSVVQHMQDLVAAGQRLTVPVVQDLMKALYQALVTKQAPRFAEMFALLLQDDTPLVLHCTAGKDRTGVAAALILLALGVPRPVVLQDYLLTNLHYRRPPLPPSDTRSDTPSDTPPEVLAVLWRVQEDFLTTALDAIDAQPGGISGFFQQRLGLDAAALGLLAARYLATD